MKTYPVTRFLFGELTSLLDSSEISGLIKKTLFANPRIKITSEDYFLYLEKEKLFWGRKIIGYPQTLPSEIFYRDFGGEDFVSFAAGPFSWEGLDSFKFHSWIQAQEQKFDLKIEKMILSMNTGAQLSKYQMDIFVE